MPLFGRHIESEIAPITRQWYFWLGAVFVASAVTLLVGKLFRHWDIDSTAVILFLIIWIPFIIPLLRRLKYKDIEIEFVERVKQVEADVATLTNQTEIENDEKKKDIRVDPYKVRLKYTSNRFDQKYFDVKVWLDAPNDFIEQVDKVVFERHPTFKRRFVEVRHAPFEDAFKCWGEFTIRAEITLKNGERLRRQRYLALEADKPEVDDEGS
jgi:hypothetical protein